MRPGASSEHHIGPGPDRTANLLGAMALAVSDRLVAAAEAAGGSMTRSAAVVLVDQVPRCSVEWLSRRLDLSHSATVRVVDRLTTDGLVRRAPGPDARTVALEATADGSRLAAEVKAARLAVLRDVLGDLSDDRRDDLVRVAEALLYETIDEVDQAWRVCRLCDPARCVDPTCPVLDAVTDLSSRRLARPRGREWG